MKTRKIYELGAKKMTEAEKNVREKFGYEGECTFRNITMEEVEKNKSYQEIDKVWKKIINDSNVVNSTEGVD